MEVIIPSSSSDFNFDSPCSTTSPCTTSPSSPRPLDWEEKSGISKAKATTEVINNNEEDHRDFEFDFSEHLERTSLSADELFDGGKIKPFRPPPPPRSQRSDSVISDSPRSPISPKLPSPRQRKKGIDPFAMAIEQTRFNQRGRERKCNSMPSISRHKGTRSWSPFRVSDFLFEREEQKHNSPALTTTKTSSPSSLNSISSWRGYRKWRLKDLLLFRSASEGRASSKATRSWSGKKSSDDGKNSSFRSMDSAGSVSGSRKRGPVSAHELHYRVNRTVSEQMKRRTFLPYNRGLLGCLGFNPAVDEFSRGLGSSPRG